MEEILASIRKIISEDTNDTPSETEAAAPSLAPVGKAEPVEVAPDDVEVLELTKEIPVESDPATAESVAEEPPTADDIDFKTVDAPAETKAEVPGPAPAAEPEAPVAEAKTEVPAESVVQPESQPAPAPTPASAAPAAPAPAEGVFSGETRNVLGDAMASIARAFSEDVQAKMAEPSAPAPSGDEQALGALILGAVRERVDQSVREWLDGNRTALVEDMKPYIRDWMDEHFPAILERAVRAEMERIRSARNPDPAD